MPAAFVAMVGTVPARADTNHAKILSIIQSTPSGKAPDLEMKSANNMNLASIDFKGARLYGAAFTSITGRDSNKGAAHLPNGK